MNYVYVIGKIDDVVNDLFVVFSEEDSCFILVRNYFVGFD